MGPCGMDRNGICLQYVLITILCINKWGLFILEIAEFRAYKI